jgi:hypothetical protein
MTPSADHTSAGFGIVGVGVGDEGGEVVGVDAGAWHDGKKINSTRNANPLTIRVLITVWKFCFNTI